MADPKERPRGTNLNAALDGGALILLELLKEKAQFDWAVVTAATPSDRLKYTGFVKGRVHEEYLDVLDAFRAALVHWGESFAAFIFKESAIFSKDDLTRPQRDHIGIQVQKSLESFIERYEKFETTMVQLQPTPEMVLRVRELLPEKGVTYMGDVFTNIQQSTIISRSVVDNFKQELKNVDLASLAQELSRVRSAMRQEASTPEHDMAIGKVATAETCAKKGDGEGTMQHLKDAGKWALEVATKIGTSIAADVIEKAIGLG
jgi:hypothetical protein